MRALPSPLSSQQPLGAFPPCLVPCCRTRRATTVLPLIQSFFGRDRVSMGSSHKAGAATIGAGRAFRARRSAATSVGQLGQQHLCAAGFNYAPRRHVRSLDYRRTVAAARHASAAQVSSLCAAVCGRVPPSAWCSLGQPTSIPGADARSSPATAQPLIQLIRRTIAADLRVSGLLPRYRRRFFFPSFAPSSRIEHASSRKIKKSVAKRSWPSPWRTVDAGREIGAQGGSGRGPSTATAVRAASWDQTSDGDGKGGKASPK